MDNGGLVWRRIGDHADKNPSRWHALPECRLIETKATTAARRWLAVQMATMLTVYPDQCHSVHAPSARGVIIPLTWEPVSGFEPLTCRLQEARPPAAMRASCTGDPDHRTDGTHHAGIT
jgi:hypothetical protein